MDTPERVVRFGDAESLVGILTDSADRDDVLSANPAVIFLNGGTLHRIGPHRLYVRMARLLAAAGFPVLRFDFSGLGDSPPRRDNLPFEDFGPEETRQAMDFLSAEIGARRLVLMGLCGGGHVAVQVAAGDARVVGAAAIDWYAGPMPRNRLPPLAVANAQLRAVLERGGRLFFLYTAALRQHYNHVDQLREAFPDLSRSHGVKLAFYSDADHTLTLRYHQDRLVGAVCEWMTGFATTLTRKALHGQ